MASTVFTDFVTPVPASWLNDVNAATYTTLPAVVASDALKAPIANPTFTGTVGGITKAMVGLGNVDNTADASKSVSYAATATNATNAINATNIVGGANAGNWQIGGASVTKPPINPVGWTYSSGIRINRSGTVRIVILVTADPNWTGFTTSGNAFVNGVAAGTQVNALNTANTVRGTYDIPVVAGDVITAGVYFPYANTTPTCTVAIGEAAPAGSGLTGSMP